MKRYDDYGVLEECLFVILGVIIAAAFSFIGAGIALWLWGVIAIPIFGAPVLTYWQMFGLIWLMRLIFGSRSVSTSRSK